MIVNLSLQIIPINTADAYPIIDAAISVIQKSGLKYEVQPFATLIEGPLNEVMEVAMQAKDTALEAGGEELVINIQLHLKKNKDVHFEDKTEKFHKV
jgi:uncharacterized protein YqgV (UPF0045/DUF77 family)